MAAISNNILFAVFVGFLPSLLWLWFWLKEDKNPEPQAMLFLTFFAGMAAVIVALILEYLTAFIEHVLSIEKTVIGGILLLLSWSVIEESVKYFAAKKSALDKECCDESIDILIYMITAALGFSALENILFLFKTASLEGFLSGFLVGNMRFLGATLLHTATSAIFGAAIAFSFFHKENRKRNVIGGLIIASVLHFVFNFLIIKNSEAIMIKIFIPLWIIIIFVIFIFEKVKRIKK
ncbi:MAG: PrsW family glutamic-type intramembrane protease [Patescibacteria group bacterium]